MDSTQKQESANSVFQRFVEALGKVDEKALRELTTAEVEVDVPGAMLFDITEQGRGQEELIRWAETVRQQCGEMSLRLHRYFENGCELMANGRIRMERFPRAFDSACAIHVVLEGGRIAAFQLLFDTYSLQRFRREDERS